MTAVDCKGGRRRSGTVTLLLTLAALFVAGPALAKDAPPPRADPAARRAQHGARRA